MTARNVQDEAKHKGLPWAIAKGFDTFLPISHFIPKEKIPDPHDVNLFLSVNEEPPPAQNDSTNLMIFKIPRLLASITSVMSLEPGDIVLSGTPKGVGRVRPGDVMRAGIKVAGKEIEEGKIEVKVEDSQGTYEFRET